MNKSIALYRTFFLFLLCSFIATNPALAAGVGGLDKGTNFIGETAYLGVWFCWCYSYFTHSLESIPGIHGNGLLVWRSQITDVCRNCRWLCGGC